MVIWAIFAVIATATAVSLLHPLFRRRDGLAGSQTSAALVYRDQLTELDRDARSGHLAAAEFEYARAEAARRLFKATESIGPPIIVSSSRNIFVSLAIVAFVPLLSIGLYVKLGSPDMLSRPLEARLESPEDDLLVLINRAESHLRQQPNDGLGWDVLAPMYLKMGRIPDAETAYRNALRLLGSSPIRLDGLAEALMATSRGVVTEEARTTLQQSVALEPDNAHAQFYLALALEQEGRRLDATKAFEGIAAGSPSDAPWLPLVKLHIAKNKEIEVAPIRDTEPTLDHLESANPDEQNAMIRGMVANLESKLSADPDNLNGWIRLVRAFVVLKERARAAGAMKRGLFALSPSGKRGRQLIAEARKRGLTTRDMVE